MRQIQTIAPVRPMAAYIGGKRLLAHKITKIVDATPHDTHAEAFLGMGGVFFRRSKIVKAEVVNDRNRDISTFFRVLQRHHHAFKDMLKWQVSSRAELNG